MGLTDVVPSQRKSYAKNRREHAIIDTLKATQYDRAVDSQTGTESMASLQRSGHRSPAEDVNQDEPRDGYFRDGLGGVWQSEKQLAQNVASGKYDQSQQTPNESHTCNDDFPTPGKSSSFGQHCQDVS
jgi:hypothetical protein